MDEGFYYFRKRNVTPLVINDESVGVKSKVV